MLKASDFQELVDAAITLEDDLKQVEEERRKKVRLEPQKFPTSKPTPDLSFKPRFQTRGDNPNQEHSNYGNGKICGNCGLRGHLTCRGDDLWGMPRAELFAGWRPRSLHGSKTRRPAPPGGPAVLAAG
jgi:hypothetical protein